MKYHIFNMELLRRYFLIYVLAISLSLNISSTTNSDHTNAETEWKGGDGVKRSRVRRQNLHLPDAIHLPEKAYALYVLWRLLNEVSNDTNTIRTSTMTPDKLESMTSERPKNTEIVFKGEDKPSSAPTHEQSTHSSGITVLTSFPTDPSPPELQKTTQSGDSQLVKQSPQRLQTIQKIPEPSQVTEQLVPDSTTLTIKISSKAAEEPSTIIHERIDNFTGITDSNDSTAMASFPTHSQKTTQSGDSQLVEQLTITKQKITEPSQVTEQLVPDSTTLTIKISSKAVEEPSSTIIHERIDNFTGIIDTNDSTAMASFPTHSQKTTQSGDSQLVEQLTITKQKITEPSQVTEQLIPDSTTLTIKIPSKAVEELAPTTIHDQIAGFTDMTVTPDSTPIMSFSTVRPPQEPQKKTQSGAPRLFTQQSTQHLQRSKQEITKQSQVTEQLIPDSTTLSISSKAAEEPSSTIIHERIDDFTGITDTNDSTAMASFPTHSQKTTQSGDSQLVEQLTITKQKITEPSQVTEQLIPDSTTLTIKIPSKAVEELAPTTIHDQIAGFTDMTVTPDSTPIMSFSTVLPPQEPQKKTQSGAPRLFTQQSTQHLQRSKQEITKQTQVTEQLIPDSTTLTISSKAVEEPSSTIIHERIDNFTGITDTNYSTAMASFPTHSQKTTQSGDSQLVEQLTITKQKITEPIQVTEQLIPDSTTLTIKIPSKAVEELAPTTIHDQIAGFTDMTVTPDSTPIMSFSTVLPPQEPQKKTQSGAPRLFTQQSTQHLQRSKQEITKQSQVTEQLIPDSTTLSISSKAAEEPSSTIIHERIDDFTGITDTNDSTAMASFPTHSQKTTQSGDSQLVEQLTITKQKITEPSQVTEQLIPDSTTLTIKIPSKAVEELAPTTIHDQIAGFTDMTVTPDSTPIMSFSTVLPPQEPQKKTQSGAPRLFTQQSTQHLQRSKQEITKQTQVTEQLIPDSTTLTISSKAVEEPSSTIIHERIDNFTGITDTNYSTAMASFPTHSQKTTQSGDSQLVEQSRITKQKITEPSQVTEQLIPDSTTFTIKIPSKAVEEFAPTTIHDQIAGFTDMTVTPDFTPIMSFSTVLPPQEPQKKTQSGAPRLFTQQSTQHLQRSKQEITKQSQVTEQLIPDSTTLTISSKAAEEPSSTIIHERIDNFTGITDTYYSTAMVSFPTHSPDSQKTTQSGDSQLVEQSRITKQKIMEPSQVTEQLIPDSTTLTIKISSKAAEEPSSTIIHERIDDFTGITDTNDSTAMASFPTHSQKTTQSGDSQLVEQLTITKQKITEPSQVTEQLVPDSTTLTIKISSKAVEEPSSTIIHERIDDFTGITDTNDSTAMASFPTHSQKTTQSGDSQLVEQLTITKQKIMEPSQVTEQLVPDSTTLTIKIASKAVEEPSSTIIHERIDNFTGIIDTNDSTAMASFPTHSQKTTQSGDSQLVEQSRITKQKITEPSQVTEQLVPDSTTLTIKIPSKAVEELAPTTIHDQIAGFTDMTVTPDSTPIMSFSTELPPQEPQKKTQSGAPRLFTQQSTQHLQRSKQEITKQSQVTEQLTPDSTTLTISSKAAEEPSSTIIHERIDNFTGITDTYYSTAMASFPTHSPDSQKTTQSGDSQLVEQSRITKQKIMEPSQVTEQLIPDSTTLTIKISSKAAEEPSSTIIHERIDDFTGITDTNDSTAMASFPTHSQKTTQSGDSQLVEQLTITKQKITEPSQVTEQLIPDSTTLTIKISSKAVEEPSSTIIHERIDNFTGIIDTNDHTAIASFPTHSPDSQKTTQSGDSQLVEQSRITKQKITEPSQVIEQHIPDSTTFTIKIPSKAVEEPSSTIIHERIDNFTGITDTNDSTAIASFPTHSPDSQKTTQSGDSQLVEQLTITKQEITEPSQVIEQHIPDSTTFTIKIPSKAVEEPFSTIIHERIDDFTGITDTNDSTAMASFPTHSPDSQKTTQSGDSQLVEQSRIAKQKITEPSQVTGQPIPDSTTFTIKISSEAVDEPFSTIIHERIDDFTGITDTNYSTAMASFPTHPPDSEKTTQSGDSQLVEQSRIRKQKITEQSQVTEQLIPDSTTFTNKISSNAVEEPSSTIIHERIDDFTGITDTNDSTAMASFPTHSQKTTQSGDSQLAEQLTITKQEITEPIQVTEQHIPDSTTFTIKIPFKAVEELSPTTIHDQIAGFTDMTVTPDSTAIMSFHTNQPSQRKQSTQHFQRAQIPLISTPNIATEYRYEKETPLQTTINSHITNNGMIAPTREIDSLQPTSRLQTMKHEHPRRVITGMVKGISRPTLPARTKTPTLSSSAVKLEIQETATYTHSVTWHNGKPNQFVTVTNRRDPKPTPPAFTLKQPIQDSTSLLLTVENPISDINGFTSDPEPHKPTLAEEPTNQHTEQNAINTAKSSRDSLIQHFMTTRILTNGSSVSRKTDFMSPLPSLTEDNLVDSREPGDTYMPTGISLHVSTSSAAPDYVINPKTQSQSITNKYPILGTIISHTSVLLVKETSTPAPKDRVRLSQTIPVFTEKLTATFAPNPKPSENHIITTSVVRHGFLTLKTQEIPSWISTKRSNLQTTETTEPRSNLKNQEPTTDTVAKENYINNDLLAEMDNPTQSTIGDQLSKTTRTATTKFHMSKTQKVSNSKKFIFPTHKSADTAIADDKQTRRGMFGLFFTLGCLILLIIVILLRVVWEIWQTRHWRNNNMWVAGHPLLSGTYHSVLQSSSPNTAIEMTKGNTQENSDVYESIALKQQHKDLY
ncbi:uncharacterized protein LOC143749681 [Siphateles boraxobius]|uniref:uncharacterized protein LOC143749681 n=1 Tax=Siphateles boraxobius TaxID=180520 RepID=UPI0040647045